MPTVDDNQPWAGQIDGVEAASALRLSTSDRTELKRLSRPCSTSRSSPNVFSGDCSAGSAPIAAQRRRARRRPSRGSSRRPAACSWPLQRGVQSGLGTQLADSRLQSLNLAGKRFGRDAVIRVLDFESRGGGV